MSSESQRALSPSEQHQQLSIDPFFLDLRNFDPDQLLTGPSNNSRQRQEPDVADPVATTSAPEHQTHTEHDHHSFDSPSPAPSHTSQHAVNAVNAVNLPPGSTESTLTCPSCLQTFSKPYLLKCDAPATTTEMTDQANCQQPTCQISQSGLQVFSPGVP